MKKFTRIGALAAGLTLVAATAWAGARQYQGFDVVNVVVNGKAVESDVPAVNFYGRTMLPVRAIADAIGAKVEWQAETSTAVLTVADSSATQAELAKVKAELAAKIAATSPPAPGEPGTSRVSPAPISTPVIVKVDDLTQKITAKVTVLETYRGQEAMTRIKAANQFNAAPRDGFEYILAKVRFDLLEMNDTNQAYTLTPVSFDTFSSTGRQYETVSVVPPDPKLRTELYVNASQEGWMVVTVAKDDSSPVMAFGRSYNGAGGAWFKLSK